MAVKQALPPPPRLSAGASPLRRAGSARRTSSIDTSWPDGRTGNMRMVGRARDMVTPANGAAPLICAEDGFDARVTPERAIASIQAQPARIDLRQLVGVRGGGKLRHALDEFVPGERRNATPLYLILDDLAGTSLVAGWAWSLWDPNWITTKTGNLTSQQWDQLMRDRAGVCTGFAPGSSSLDFNRVGDRTGQTPTPDLRHPADPDGWHAFTAQDEVGMRRARRIDVWLDNVIVIDAAFQDSGSTPGGERAALHEYQLSATADPDSLRLLTLEATPRVLPFSECPGAALNISRLLGTPLSGLRHKVVEELHGTLGCTHLNDALRALAEVPALVTYLRRSTQAA